MSQLKIPIKKIPIFENQELAAMRILFLFSFLFFLSKFCLSQNESLSVVDNQGGQSSYMLSQVRKMSYSGDFLNIEMNDGVLISWYLTDVRGLSFLNTYQQEELINQFFHDFDFKIFPNPASAYFQCSINLPDDKKATISLVSMDGRLLRLFSERLISKGQTDFTFPLNDISSGIYKVIFSTDGFKVASTLQIISQ